MNGTVVFNPDFHLARAALAATTDTVYIAMTGSRDTYPFHGWLFAYSLANLQQTALLLLTPNGQGAGVWQSVRAPVVDGGGNLFVETGNGDYDGVSNFGSSILKLSQSQSLRITDWFTPSNWEYLTDNDLDLASAGPLLIPGTTYLVGSGKTGVVYVLDTSNMGQIQANNSQIVQAFHGSPNNCTAGFCYEVHNLAFWNNPAATLLYLWAYGDVLRVYQWTGSQFVTTPVAIGSAASNYPGGYLSGSSNGNTAGTGILWALSGDDGSESGDGMQFGTLRAYDASSITTEIWDSDLNSARDSAGYFAKFVPPVVANGKVYVGNWSSQLVVYGLLNSSLSISKRHSGDFIQGQDGGAYTVIVTNSATAGPTRDSVTVTENVPDGLTLVSMAGSGWTCPGTAANNCMRSDQLAAGASYQALTVIVNVGASATSPQINSVTVGGSNGPLATTNDSTNILAGLPVPDVVGLTQSAATTAIQKASLVVNTVTTASSNAVPSGHVVSESPPAGTATTLGSAVNLVVSSGPALVSIAVTPANPSIAKGLTQQPMQTGTYTDNSTQNLTSQVTWSANAPGGLATGNAVGQSTVTATSGNVQGSTTLTVTAAMLQSIAVTPANPSIVVGTAQQFQATGTYTDSSTQNLIGQATWASTTTAVATITGAGKAAGVKVGASMISAMLGSIGGSTTSTVTPLGPCDVTQQGLYTVIDVQALINEALGVSPANNDLNDDGVVNVADIQTVINAVLNLGCTV